MAGLLITGFPLGRGAGEAAAAVAVVGSGYTLRRRKWIHLAGVLMILLVIL